MPGTPKTELQETSELLRRRKKPQQARGHAAVDRILEATGELLDEVGYGGVTTSHIAERAEVNIATLYRYYPNKFAVLTALAERFDGARADATADLLRQLPFVDDWRGSIAAAIDLTARQRENQAGGRALRRALQSSPELWQIDHRMTQRVADVLCEAMKALRPDLDEEVTKDLALVVVTTVTALLDLANDPAVEQSRIRTQLTDLVDRYLAPYFD